MNALPPHSGPTDPGPDHEGAPDTGGVVSCWSCHGPVTMGSIFCETCKAVQPPGQIDHFARLGLSVSFELDRTALDRAFFDRQRVLHPDRFATRSPKEKALSQSQSVSLNEAYEALKDDLARADYMVHLLGVAAPGAPLPDGCNLVNDPVILMESMEQREKLAAADTVEAVSEIEAGTQDSIRVCLKQLSELFANDDYEGACRLTTRLKYLRKLADEIRQHKIKLAAGA